MGRASSLEARLDDLEIRYTHQQDELKALADVAWEQRQLIDRLMVRIERLEQQLSADEDEPPERE